MIALVGRDVIFLLNVASFIVSAACLVVALGHPRAANGRLAAIAHNEAREPAGRRRARVSDGLLIALSQPRIFLLLAIVAAVTFANDPILVLRPALPIQNFISSATGLVTSLGPLAPDQEANWSRVIDCSRY